MPKRTFEISQLDNNGIVATSAPNTMLECIRVVSPEPLIVPVSSNGALFGELGQDRCAVCPCAMPTYIGLLKLQARRQRPCSHVLRSARFFNSSG